MLEDPNIDSSLRHRLENDCDTAHWPSWELPILPNSVTFTFELAFLVILLFFTFFRRAYRLSTRTSQIREVIHCVLTAAAMIDIITAWITFRGHTLASLVRPFLFIFFVR